MIISTNGLIQTLSRSAKLKFDLKSYLENCFGKPRKSKFTKKEKLMLRPIAEVLCLLDGNAFFGISIDDNGEDTWYEQYLPEAYVIWKSNGGMKGWASQVSWIRETNHENETVADAWMSWQLLKILAKTNK